MRVTLRTGKVLRNCIQKAAKEKGVSMNAWMVEACWAAVERWERVKEQQERKN